MKGIILAGGTGSRLRPVTHHTAKQLVPLGRRTVIEHVIENLKQVGIDDIGVVFGNNSPDQIQTQLGNGSHLGVDVTYILQGEPLGLAHAVGCAQDFVGDESFVVYFGDTILDNDITSGLVNAFDPTVHDVGMPLQRVDDPSRFGIAQFDDDGNVERVLEKPDDPPSDHAYVGAIAFTPAFFDIVETLEPSERGELELTDAIDRYIRDGGNAAVFECEGTWKDVGTPQDVIETNKIILEAETTDVRGTVHESATVDGTLVLGPNSKLEADVTVQGPVVIGSETTIETGTTIGPNVTVGDCCTIRAGQLESSVVFDDAIINTERTVTQSILGSNASLRDDATDDAVSCLLGWHTSVQF